MFESLANMHMATRSLRACHWSSHKPYSTWFAIIAELASVTYFYMLHASAWHPRISLNQVQDATIKSKIAALEKKLAPARRSVLVSELADQEFKVEEDG